MSTNEAAERLRRRFGHQLVVKADKHGTETASDVLDDALAHERSTGAAPLDVEVLTEAISEAMAHVPWPGERGAIKFGGLTYRAAARAIATEYARLLDVTPSQVTP